MTVVNFCKFFNDNDADDDDNVHLHHVLSDYVANLNCFCDLYRVITKTLSLYAGKIVIRCVFGNLLAVLRRCPDCLWTVSLEFPASLLEVS